MLAANVRLATPSSDAAVPDAQHALAILRHLSHTSDTPEEAATWMSLGQQITGYLPSQTSES